MKNYSSPNLIVWIYVSHTVPKIWVLPFLVTPHCSQVLRNFHAFPRRQSLRPMLIAYSVHIPYFPLL